ncbi:stalk domain-containing protein [Anaerotignum sp.]|uniref:stalk domain-containing protein n=1 Tax=Anaerotignum sp. TaxID=2039241 RepID=UPI00333085B5
MNHFSKQFSWLLAFVLMFTSIVSTNITAYASETIIIGEDTDEVITDGTSIDAEGWYYATIRYYESADSNTVIYEDRYASTIGSLRIATKPYAWHVTFVEKVQDNSATMNPTTYYFKAYPDTSLEIVPIDTEMTLPAGTTLATTGAEINVSVYVEDTLLKNSSSSSVTLPTIPQLSSYVGEDFESALNDSGYHLPDLTDLYYTVVLTDKSESPYSLKLTLLPTVEVTFDENTGSPDLTGITMYATPEATIDSMVLPEVSLDNFDFYGWKKTDDTYVSLANVSHDNPSSLIPRVSDAGELKAMYQEIKPTFTLDLTNKKVANLLSNRTYAYPLSNWEYATIGTDAEGGFCYEGLSSFESLARLRLNSENTDILLDSEFVPLKHNEPKMPVIAYTATTAKVTNTNELDGCEFAIRATSSSSSLNWGTSSEFPGLTPETSYKVYTKHIADENGFESNAVESSTFSTLATKTVSNETPNGVTIADIPNHVHRSSAIEPTLMIKDGETTLALGTDYTVAYSNNINVGTATATVTFTGNYSGTMMKNFNIVRKNSSSSDESTAPTPTPTVTVTFNTDGGTTVGIKNIKKGSTIGEIPSPTKEGFVFEGWYANKELTFAYDANTKISASTTLFAKWIKEDIKLEDSTSNEIVFTIGNKNASVFGIHKANDVAPIIKNNRTMLPARYVAENLGAVVAWNGEKQEVTIKGNNKFGEEVIIIIYINSEIAYVNGKEIKLESPAFIEGGRTYTPIRFISEKLGATITWLESEQKVVIKKK